MANYGYSTGASGYDEEDRITNWQRSDGNLDHSWTLSPAGNWTSITENGTATILTHGNAHEMATVGAATVTHDVKGNVTSNANGHTYSWTQANELAGADTDGQAGNDVTFTYDALDRRVSKDDGATTVVYVSANQQVIAEYASGAVPTAPGETYVYGDYIDEPIQKTGTSGTVYYHHNAQYSVTALTDPAGSTVERYAYAAHGAPLILAPDGTTVRTTSSYNNSYTYTGRRLDVETGLYYFRARYHDPSVGRFLSRDPLGYEDGSSLYKAYFDVADYDPSGLLALDELIQSLVGNVSGCFDWQWPFGPGFVKLSICFEFAMIECCSDKDWREFYIKVALSAELSYMLGYSVEPFPDPIKGKLRNKPVPHPCKKGKTVKLKDYAKEKAKCPTKHPSPGVDGGVSGKTNGCPEPKCEVKGKLFIKAKAGIFIGVHGSVEFPITGSTRFPDVLDEAEGTIGVGVSGSVGASIEVGGGIEGECIFFQRRQGCCKGS